MKYLLIILTVILEIIAWWYLIVLVSRTEFLARSTSIGNDVILMMYVLCALTCAISAYLIYRKDIHKLVSITLFIIAFLPSVGFLYMNMSGKVAEIKKAALNNQQQYIQKDKQS